MVTNRFISLLIAISLFAIVVLVVREANATPSLVANVDSAARSYSAWAKAAEAKAEASTVDSATRSYLAWAEAADSERTVIDSATRSYIAWAAASDSERAVVDSATRSYIAWALYLLAAPAK